MKGATLVFTERKIILRTVVFSCNGTEKAFTLMYSQCLFFGIDTLAVKYAVADGGCLSTILYIKHKYIRNVKFDFV
jgi:hypothetical protein